MSLHALDAIDDALNATRRYRPRGLFEWIWVVGVAALVGSPAIGLPTGGSGGGSLTPEQQASLEEAVPATVPAEYQGLAVALVAGLIAGWLLLVVLGAFLEFPFLRWLRDGDLAIREEGARHWKGALGLAIFRLVVNGLSLAIVAGAAVALVGRGAHPVAYVLALADFWYAFALLGLAFGFVTAFTTAFVVPAMWLEGRGVLSGWRRVWPTLAGAPKQFLAYVVLVAILAAVGGIIVFLAAFAAFVPGVIAGLLAASAAGAASGLVVGIVFGGALTVVLVGAVFALLQTYLRYYALFVLGDVDADLDAIPGRRRAVRTDGGDGDNGNNGGDGDDGGGGDDGIGGGDGLGGGDGGIGGGDGGIGEVDDSSDDPADDAGVR